MRIAQSTLLPTASVALIALAAGASSLACGGTPAHEAEEIGESRAALSTLVVEAESASGAGIVEADPTASSGQLRAFSNVYDAATASFTTNGTLQSGTVRVRAAQCGSSPTGSAQYAQVLVDGAIVLTQMISTAGAWVDLPLAVAGFPAGPHTITFKYRMGVNGCTFRYDQATFSVEDPAPDPPDPPAPVVLEAENAIGSGTVEADPTASNGQRRAFATMYQSAEIPLTTTATTTSITIRALGTQCSTPPMVAVFVDGQSVLSKSVPLATWDDYSQNVSIPPGSHTIALQYRWSGGRGCLLRIDKATFAFD